MNRSRKTKGSFLGSIAGVILNLFTRSKKLSASDLKKANFPHSTQKTGIRFNEKVRDIFRPKWLKRK